MSLRLIIADDHPMLVDGLTRVLGEVEGITLLESAPNGAILLERLRVSPADIVLLDLHMPRMDGVATLKVLTRDFPRTRVIVFTSYNQPKLVKEIRDAGARGFLLKSSTSRILKEAIIAVAAGQLWFQNEEPEPIRFTDDFVKKYQLTSREVEVIRRVARGITSKDIAREMFISEFTVNTHRRNICRKLDIYTPAGLVSFAREHGIA